MPCKSDPSVSEVVEFIIDLIEHQQHTKKNMVECLARCERFWCFMTELVEAKWCPEKEVYLYFDRLKDAIIEASHEQDTETTMFTYNRLRSVRHVQNNVNIVLVGTEELERMDSIYSHIMVSLKNIRQELEELIDSMFSVQEDSACTDDPDTVFMSVPLLVDNCFSGGLPTLDSSVLDSGGLETKVSESVGFDAEAKNPIYYHPRLNTVI